MGKPVKPLTDKEFERIKDLEAQGLSWSRIRLITGITDKRICKYYRNIDYEKIRVVFRTTDSKNFRDEDGNFRGYAVNALYDPARDGLCAHTDYTARVMGDPFPGRRAMIESHFAQEYSKSTKQENNDNA